MPVLPRLMPLQCAELLGTLASGNSAPAVSLIVQLLKVPLPRTTIRTKKRIKHLNPNAGCLCLWHQRPRSLRCCRLQPRPPLPPLQSSCSFNVALCNCCGRQQRSACASHGAARTNVRSALPYVLAHTPAHRRSHGSAASPCEARRVANAAGSPRLADIAAIAIIDIVTHQALASSSPLVPSLSFR